MGYFGTAVSVSGDVVVVGAPDERELVANGIGANDPGGTMFSYPGFAHIFELKRPNLTIVHGSGAHDSVGVSSVRFGAVPRGGHVDSLITLKNSGSANLTEFSLTIGGQDSDQFSVTTNPSESAMPGESTSFTVRFSPTSEGTKTATLHIASNDPHHNPFDLTLVGTPNVPTGAASGNDLAVSFVGTPGSRYRVQYLPGLTGSWTDFVPPALYTVPASGVISHTDRNPPDTLRLYRAVLVP